MSIYIYKVDHDSARAATPELELTRPPHNPSNSNFILSFDGNELIELMTTYQATNELVDSFFYLFIDLYIYLFICLFMYLCVYSFLYLRIYIYIYIGLIHSTSYRG